MNRNAMTDLRKHTLSAIPSMFGKLVYLSTLRNVASNRYEHYGLSLVFGEKDAEKALRAGHNQIFQDWLTHDLEQQKADLDLYLSDHLEEAKGIVDCWLEKTMYQDFVPNNARPTEKQLFSADCAALLWIFKNGSEGLTARPTA